MIALADFRVLLPHLRPSGTSSPPKGRFGGRGLDTDFNPRPPTRFFIGEEVAEGRRWGNQVKFADGSHLPPILTFGVLPISKARLDSRFSMRSPIKSFSLAGKLRVRILLLSSVSPMRGNMPGMAAERI